MALFVDKFYHAVRRLLMQGHSAECLWTHALAGQRLPGMRQHARRVERNNADGLFSAAC